MPEKLAELLGVTRQATSKSLNVMGIIQKLLQRQNWKGFLHRIVTGDEKWVHCDNPKTQKIMENAWTWLHVDGQIEYSRCQGYALHLVWPARCGVLWAVGTEWNHHRGSVSNAIDAFEPSIEGEMVTVPKETRQSYPPAWQCLATCRQTGQDILGNGEMGGFTPPAVRSRRCSFRLPFVSIVGILPGSSIFSLLWRSFSYENASIVWDCIRY